MKTRDAFAFLSFNGERILQRRFFKEWRERYRAGTGKTDAEILDNVGENLSGSSLIPQFSIMHDSTLQLRLDALDDLIKCVTAYQRHLKKHVGRVTKYTNAVANIIAAADETADMTNLRARHKRATKLAEKYRSCAASVDGLTKKLHDQYKVVENEVGYKYRKLFGERLRQARLAAGLTQTQLGERLRLSQKAISGYEVGTREPNLAQVARFAYLLNKRVDWLLGAKS